MSCKRFERLIALHVEGDLAERQVCNVEFHLAGCAACRRFADELKVSQVALKNLRHETICQADLRVLRQRVIDAVAGAQPNGRAAPWMDGFGARWRWAGVALASVAVLVMAGVHFSLMYLGTPSGLVHEQTVTVQEVGTTVPVSPLAQPQLADEVEAAPAAVETPVIEAAAHPPVVIKMLTNNPDVVIILVTNGKEKTEHVPKA